MPPKKVPFRKTGRTGREAIEKPKAKGGTAKSNFVKREIGKGNLKKVGNKIVDAKAKTPTPKAPTPKAKASPKASAPLPTNNEVFKMKNKLIELAREEEELIETDGATPKYLKTLSKMMEETPIWKNEQPRLLLAKAIKPTAKSTKKTLIQLYREARKKDVIKGDVLKEWNDWKQEIANGYKMMRVDEIGLTIK